MEKDRLIFGSTNQHIINKGKSRNPIFMTFECSNTAPLLQIKDFNDSVRESDCQDAIMHLEATYVCPEWRPRQLLHILRSVQEDLVVKSSSKRSSSPPVQIIQIKIVPELGDIEHFNGTLYVRIESLGVGGGRLRVKLKFHGLLLLEINDPASGVFKELPLDELVVDGVRSTAGLGEG
jgi:hypothetical protein